MIRTFVGQYRVYVIFGGILVAGLLAFLVVSGGYYPIMFLNGRFISARAFWKNYQAASVYYGQLLATYQPLLSGDKVQEFSPQELRPAVLTKMVHDVLVDQELRRVLDGDLDRLVRARIDRFRLDEDTAFQSAARDLYGLGYNDVRKLIIVPQAKWDILAGRLFLEDKTMDEWLTEAKQASNIILFSGSLYWDGEQATLREL